MANVLYSTSYIERWGSGVKRITDAYAYRNVETPTWTTDGYFVTVTFKRPDYNANISINVPKDDTINDTKDDTKDCIKELSDRQYLMMRFITLNDTITIDEMIQKMKVS
ncbi:MAG: ATP-binding protein, partial [Bacteroides sp.]